jgi:hypothetical protein
MMMLLAHTLRGIVNHGMYELPSWCGGCESPFDSIQAAFERWQAIARSIQLCLDKMQLENIRWLSKEQNILWRPVFAIFVTVMFSSIYIARCW